MNCPSLASSNTNFIPWALINLFLISSDSHLVYIHAWSFITSNKKFKSRVKHIIFHPLSVPLCLPPKKKLATKAAEKVSVNYEQLFFSSSSTQFSSSALFMFDV